VLEAGIQVSLLIQAADVLEVRVVYVGIHAEETLVDGFSHFLSITKESVT